MLIPTSPTLLMAAASLAMIAGRFFRVCIARKWGLLYYVAVLLIASALPASSFLSTDSMVNEGIEAVFVDDTLARSEQWIVLVFGLVAGIVVVDAHRNTQSTLSLYGLMLFGVAGLILVARANDLLALGLSLEILNCVVRGLQIPEEHSTSTVTKNDRHIYRPANVDWPNGIASGLMWLGIAIFTIGANSTNLSTIRLVLKSAYDYSGEQAIIGAPSKLILLGAGLIAMSLFSRMGLVPFYHGTVSSHLIHGPMLSGVSHLVQQLSGAIAVTRLCGVAFVTLGTSMSTLLMSVTLASFVVSAFLAMRGQSPGIKSIPYWTASLDLFQISWFCVGLTIAASELDHPELRWGTIDSYRETLAICVYLQGAILLSSGTIYWTLGHLSRLDREPTYLEDFKGLIQFSTIPSMTLIVAMTSAIGGPFTMGFWGRWLIFLAGHSSHSKTSSIFTPLPGIRLVILAGTIATLPIAVIVIRLAREMFLESPLARPTAIGGRGALIVSSIATIAIVLLGFVPQIAFDPMQTIRPAHAITRDAGPKGNGQVPLSQNRIMQ